MFFRPYSFKQVIFLALFFLVAQGCTATAANVTVTPISTPTSAPITLVAVQPTPLETQQPKPSPTATLTPLPSPSPTHTVSPSPTALLTATAQNTSCPCAKYVIIISIDGLRPDAIDQADAPTLDTLIASGAYQPAAQAVLPSVTLVNHASMLGGTTPEKHGIYWNSNEPDLGKIKGPTLFSVAHDAGLSTAMVVGKPKLEHLVLPNSVDNFVYAGFTDRQVTNEALAIIQAELPNLLFIHLPDVDSAGHALGWMSLGQLLAVGFTDGLLGEVITTLEKEDYLSQTLIIVTADHGGTDFKHGSDSPEDMTIPWLAVGPDVPAGLIVQQPVTTYDTAATALFALGLAIPAEWDGQPVREIFEQR